MDEHQRLPQPTNNRLAVPENGDRAVDAKRPDLLASFADPEKRQEIELLRQVQEDLARCFFAQPPLEKLPEWAVPVDVPQQEQAARNNAEQAKAQKLKETTGLIQANSASFQQMDSLIHHKEKVLRSQFQSCRENTPSSFAAEKQEIERRAAMIEQRFVEVQQSIRAVEQVLHRSIIPLPQQREEQ